jgi:tetratricopeptide (TPR) repeat protein
MTRSLLLPLALMLALAACSSAEDRKADFLRQGELLFEQRNYEKARLEFRNALQIDPDDPVAQTLAARAAEKVGEFVEAAQFYRAAMADGENLAARAGLAKLLLLAGNTTDAATLVDEGLARAPEAAHLIVLRGALRARQGDSASARADAELALGKEPANEDGAALLASLLSQAQDFPRAIAVVQKVSQQRPENLELRIILAQLHLNAGHRPEAEAQLKRVIAMDPATLAHHYRLAQFHLAGDDVAAAETALRAAMQANPADPAPKLALANLIASRRSYEEGETGLKQLVSANRRDFALQLGLGRFYTAHGKLTEAREVYAAVIAADKANSQRVLEARNLLAAIALREGRPDEALRQIDAVLKENPRDADALVARARQSLAKGDASSAIGDLRAVLRDQPGSQPLLRALAQAYRTNGDDSLAEEALRSAVQVNPLDIPTRLALAQMLISTSRADEAQPVVDQLLIDQPGDVASLEAAFQVQRARRDLMGARRSATAILAAQPNLPTGYYLLGIVEEAEGKLEAARGSFEKAVQLAPEVVEPLTAALRVDMALKQTDKAISRVDAVVARYPEASAVHDLRAQVLAAASRYDAAIAAGEQAIKLRPGWWQPYGTVAAVQLAAERPDAALAAYSRGIEATGAAQLTMALAQQQARGGRVDEAIGTYEAWLKRDPLSHAAANNLAVLLVTHKAGDSAALQRAGQLTERFQNSSNAAFLDTLGWVRYQRGEFNEALPPLQRAVDLAPRAGQLLAHLGLAQYRAGQTAAARRTLERVLDQATGLPEEELVRQALAELQKGG